MERNKRWKVIRLAFFILLFLIAVNAFLPTLTSDEFHAFVERKGILGPLFVILYIIASHVFAPLSGFPVFVASAAVFGLLKTQVLMYAASLISACINFLISRRYGRGAVRKLAGEEMLTQIDSFAQSFGTWILVLGRLIGFAIFDVISYAAGLTAMSFRRYILITAVFSLISKALIFFVFRTTDFASARGVLLAVGTLFFASILFSLLFKRHVRKKEGEVDKGE